MADLKQINELLQKGKADDVKRLVQEAVNEKIPAEKILQEGLISAMKTVGERMQRGEAYVPEVLIAARAMNAGLTILEPVLVAQGVKPRGSIAIGTVKGDLHDIGKNLVAMMFKGAGFKVIDLGVDVSAEKYVAAFKEHNPDVMGLSALLTTTMVNMGPIIKALRDAGYKGIVEVGGAPVTESFAKEIGADAYGDDAASAVDKALAVMK